MLGALYVIRVVLKSSVQTKKVAKCKGADVGLEYAVKATQVNQ
jgi:hypothetical protein